MPRTNTTVDADVRRLTRRSIALILAGGRGSRLLHLTDRRAKPAVYFGGKYRIIDFTLSNCINSGVRRIYVLTQYKSHSLLRHLQRGWAILRGELNEFIDLVPAQQRVDESLWYRGTADAVWQNMDILRDEAPDYVIILAGDHIYKMDYGIMLGQHVARGADLTVGCVEVSREAASAFGVMAVDEQGNVLDFLEKPENPPGLPDKPDRALASMGIYVFNTNFLFEQLERDAQLADSAHDFGRDFLPYLVGRARVMAHRLRESCILSEGQTQVYWRDVGTVDAYWEANIELTGVTPALDLYDRRWPIFTHSMQLPPPKFVFDSDDRRGTAVDSVVADGSIVSGAVVRRGVLGYEVRVNSHAELNHAVILPRCNIGRHAKLRNVVVDRGCVIPAGLVVGEDPVEDARRFHVTEGGVTLITEQMLEALNA